MQTISKKPQQKERMEIVLVRLNSLKSKVIDLRNNLEKLKAQTEIKSRNKCEKCKNPIIKGEEVTFSDHSGKIIQHFHKKCFERLIASIN